MSESNKINLGGFPPIFEIVSTIKNKEFKPNTILSIQAILKKSNFLTKISNLRISFLIIQIKKKIDIVVLLYMNIYFCSKDCIVRHLRLGTVTDTPEIVNNEFDDGSADEFTEI